MIGFIFKRFFQSFIVMFLVALLAFTMFNFLGDPVNQMVGIDTTAADREALRDRLGLNDPLFVQFGRFIGNALQFEFGQSYQHKRAVSGLILDRMPATLELSLISAIFTLAVGVPMGVHTGLHRNSLMSKIFMTVSLIGVSLPTFLIGILLIFVFFGAVAMAAVLRPR